MWTSPATGPHELPHRPRHPSTRHPTRSILPPWIRIASTSRHPKALRPAPAGYLPVPYAFALRSALHPTAHKCCGILLHGWYPLHLITKFLRHSAACSLSPLHSPGMTPAIQWLDLPQPHRENCCILLHGWCSRPPIATSLRHSAACLFLAPHPLHGPGRGQR